MLWAAMAAETRPQWTFLTNHAHVLIALRGDSELRLRDLAEVVGITERATHRIICELREAGYLSIEKQGRRNRYDVVGEMPLRHPLERKHSVGELLDVLAVDKLPGETK